MPAATPSRATPPGRTLLREFARLLLLAVVLPVLVLGGLFLWQASGSVRAQTAARLAAAAASNGREIDSFLRMHLVALQVLAERRDAAGDVDDAVAWTADLRRLHQHYPTFDTLLVADRTGQLLLSQPAVPGAPTSHSVADRDYFRAPRSSGRGHVSDAFRGRVLGDAPLVAVSAPLSAGGRFAGVVEGSIRLDALAQRSRWLQARGFELLLLDRNHAVVQASGGMPYRPLDVLRDAGRDGALRALTLPGSVAGMRRLRDVLRDGGDAYASAVPLDLGWSLLLLLPDHVVEAELRRSATIMLGLLSLVLVGVLVIAWIKMQRLGGSVRGMLERMQQFALDRAPAPIVPEHMPHELATLADAMRQLAARARAAYDEVSLSLQEQRRLREELQAVAQRLLTVQEDERRTLSRELHDDIGQAITAIKLGASSLGDAPTGASSGAMPAPDGSARQEIVDEIIATADQTIVKLRNLSLLLRPPQLDSLGLEAALRSQVAMLARNARGTITLHAPPLPRRPSPQTELACFRIAQEALTNAMRHAGADHIEVSLDVRDDTLLLQISDDGRGLDPARPGGLGLLTMRERAQQLGGTLAIEAGTQGGTRVRATLPMHPTG